MNARVRTVNEIVEACVYSPRPDTPPTEVALIR